MNIKHDSLPNPYRFFLINGTLISLSLFSAPSFADLSINNSEKIVSGGETFDANGDVYAGRNKGYVNPGVLTISNGGIVINRLGYIGYINGAKGVVTVTGANSQWNNTSELSVGFQGNGKLTIADGATVTNTYGYVGHQQGDGAVVVSGANSSWHNSNDLTLAHTDSTAALLIENGATVTSTNGYIALYNSNATALITGSGSQWINRQNLSISSGSGSKGSLTLTDGGSVTAKTILVGDNGSIVIGGVDQPANPGYIYADKVNLGTYKSTIDFNHTATNYQFAPAITSAGLVNVSAGSTVLTGINTYWGSTIIHSGAELSSGVDGAFSPNSKFTLEQDATLRLLGTQQKIANLSNSGVVIMNDSTTTSGANLTITGNYIGDNGSLIFNSLLAGDNSTTDHLLVEGNTSGTTNVSVIRVGGLGADTINGIKLIEVKGSSDGEFVQKGRIVAGAYEYFLHKNSINNTDGNWYLRSELPAGPYQPEKPPAPPEPEKPSKPSKPGVENDPETPPDGTTSNNLQRPESGSYMANMAIASQMFNLRLIDRHNQTEDSSMWLRQLGSHTRFRDDSGQLRNQTNRYVVQGGGELLASQFSDTDHISFGAMLGYGAASTHTDSSVIHYSSKGHINGYNAGLYATWYQNAKTQNGLYLDSWANYSWLHASVDGEGLDGERYKIKGFSASLETGYQLPLWQSEAYRVAVTPQAQVIWNGLKADNHTESNGTQIQSDGSNNIQTRLGVKLSQSHLDQQSIPFTVYTEANWLKNSKLMGSTLDNVSVHQAGSRNLAELKVGAEGQITRNTTVWTNLAQQLGNESYRDTLVHLGLKYQF
ncbi:hypothetical protein SOASR032_12810 [Pragia fontium]|uniref:Autotransporter domain-containing protein n=1 Tax=Pragia fontium TaxID=82985 RepID=A0ABQ5LIC1_9GAMM|nr:autotransporter outer membrane beta-barrel domain-containing protein [Pragia fontium]GKX62712.1 hypothetical protein SOASR032_12810 [Pragia fontium]